MEVQEKVEVCKADMEFKLAMHKIEIEVDKEVLSGEIQTQIQG